MTIPPAWWEAEPYRSPSTPQCEADERAAADEVFRWLAFDTTAVADAGALLDGLATRLSAAGLDLWRINMQMRPLSPQIAALLYVWRPVERGIEMSSHAQIIGQNLHTHEGGVVQITSLGHGVFASPSYLASPFYRIVGLGEREVRRSLADPSTFDFPILRDLLEQGATDYLALPLLFHGTAPCAISFVTRRAGGFLDRHLALLRRVIAPFSLAMSPWIMAYATRTLLGAYLGAKTGDKVLAGKVERGDVEEIDATLWFSDLRGFTPMSRGVPSRELIGWLNDYFAAVARAIQKHDGEILKFIGDAILAVWPVTEARSREAACRAALAAARDANDELDRLNADRAARGLAPMNHGIGLHVGPVQYGNIGAEGRLDFTVIGPAVNMASRIESTCAKLSRRVLASAAVAAHAGEALVSLGRVELKGIDGTPELFGLPEPAGQPGDP